MQQQVQLQIEGFFAPLRMTISKTAKKSEDEPFWSLLDKLFV